MKIRVHRKGHIRTTHVKRAGKRVVRIPTTKVAPSTYLTTDKGKPGRTPKAKRFLKVGELKGQLGEGYTKLPASTRRNMLRSMDKKQSITSREVWNHMHGLANVTTNRKAKKVFKTDASWVMNHLMNPQEKKAMTSAARQAK